MLLLTLALIFLLIKPTSIFATDPIVKITNFSSNSLPEWVEINNNTEDIIDINNWIIKDNNESINDDLTISGCISPHSFQTFYKNSNWLNNKEEVIYLYDNSNQLIDKLSYESGKVDNSPKSDNTCTPTLTPTLEPIPTITPTLTNTPTPTKIPTSTPTLTPTKTPTSTPTLKITSAPSATITPTSNLTPTPTINGIIEPSPTPEPSVLGDVSSSNNNPKKNYLGVIFISLGGLLLLSPLFINKLQQCKKNSSKK